MLTGAGGLTYQPEPELLQHPPGTTLDTFTYTLAPGGDDGPCRSPSPVSTTSPWRSTTVATVVEDAAATAIAVLTNDTDVDGGSEDDRLRHPARQRHRRRSPDDGTGLTYQPEPQLLQQPSRAPPRHVHLHADPGGDNGLVSVTVTCVDDAPVAVDDTATVARGRRRHGDPGADQRHRHRRRPEDDQRRHRPGQRHRRAHRRRRPGSPTSPTANYCNSPPGTTLDTFTYTLTPGGDTGLVSVTVTCVNDPPVAGDDSFTGANAALANTRLVVGTTSTGPNLTITGSVLTNDTDVDTPTGLTAGPATISSANCAGCNNVTMEADGNFIYDPPAGFTGTDTFTYTVNDNDPEAPPNQTDTATVTIEVVGPLVWYVDIDAAAPPAGQGGRSHSPFNSLAPLTTGGPRRRRCWRHHLPRQR